ncbi:uncharacterized protein BJ171DRAFT_486632 [Polychytrium aggregatum]|uniref:uncharacterized protein n=1 Tax=Polychytrium aggregatum TaxID=110093 RepID=UPI0022FE115B|nr:uncharacterized protein BJ171DRAFT_486632 [Polychytrium aggregatum]KAI9209371.1 hypothetical protein BJ171DRAFT_486632 [Polychytrium aggregatum]
MADTSTSFQSEHAPDSYLEPTDPNSSLGSYDIPSLSGRSGSSPVADPSRIQASTELYPPSSSGNVPWIDQEPSLAEMSDLADSPRPDRSSLHWPDQRPVPSGQLLQPAAVNGNDTSLSSRSLSPFEEPTVISIQDISAEMSGLRSTTNGISPAAQLSSAHSLSDSARPRQAPASPTQSFQQRQRLKFKGQPMNGSSPNLDQSHHLSYLDGSGDHDDGDDDDEHETTSASDFLKRLTSKVPSSPGRSGLSPLSFNRPGSAGSRTEGLSSLVSSVSISPLQSSRLPKTPAANRFQTGLLQETYDEPIVPASSTPAPASVARASLAGPPHLIELTPRPSEARGTPATRRSEAAGAAGNAYPEFAKLGLKQREEMVNGLKKENFDLKLRIYYLTEELRKSSPEWREQLTQEKYDYLAVIEELESNLRESRQNMEGLQDTAAHYQAELQMQLSETTRLRQQLESLTADLKALRGSQESSRKEMDSVRADHNRRLDAAYAENSALQLELSRLRDELVAKDTALDASKRDVSKLAEDLAVLREASSDETVSMQRAITALRDQLADKDQHSDAIAKLYDQVLDELKEQKKLVTLKNEELRGCNDKISDLTRQLDHHTSESTQASLYSTARAELEREYQEKYETDMDNYRHKVALEHNRVNQMLHDQLSVLKRELQKQQTLSIPASSQKLQEENRELHQALSEKENIIQELYSNMRKERLSVSRRPASRASTEATPTETHVDEIIKKNVLLESELRETRFNLTQERARVSAQTAEIERLQSAIQSIRRSSASPHPSERSARDSPTRQFESASLQRLLAELDGYKNQIMELEQQLRVQQNAYQERVLIDQQLQQQIGTKDQAIKTLERQLQQQRQALEDALAQSRASRGELNENHKEILELTQRFSAEKRSEADRLLKEMDAQREEAQKLLQQANESWSRENSKALNTISSLQMQLVQAKAEAESLTKEIGQLKSQLAKEKDTNKSSMESAEREYHGQVQSLSQKVVQLTTQVTALESENRVKTSHISELTMRLDESSSHAEKSVKANQMLVGDLEAKLTDMRGQIVHYQQKALDDSAHISKLQVTITTLQSDIQIQQKQIRELKEQESQWKEMLVKKSEELDAIRGKDHRFQEYAETVERKYQMELASKEELLATSQKERDQWRAKYKEEERKRRESQSELEQTIEGHLSEVSALNATVRQKTNLIRQLEEHTELEARKLTELQSSHTSVINVIKKDLSRSREDNESLRLELLRERETTKGHLATIDELTSNLDKQAKQSRKLVDQINSLEITRAKLDQRIHSLLQEIAAKKASIEELESVIEDMREATKRNNKEATEIDQRQQLQLKDRNRLLKIVSQQLDWALYGKKAKHLNKNAADSERVNGDGPPGDDNDGNEAKEVTIRFAVFQDQLIKKLRQLQKIRASYEEKIAAFAEKVQKEVKLWEENLASRNDQIKRLEVQIDIATLNYREALERNGRLISQQDTHLKTIESLEKEIKQLQANSQREQGRVAHLEKQIEIAEQAATNLRSTKKLLEEQLKNTEQRLDSARNRGHSDDGLLEARIRELEQKVRETLEILEIERVAAETKIREFEEKCRGLERELDITQRRCRYLEEHKKTAAQQQTGGGVLNKDDLKKLHQMNESLRQDLQEKTKAAEDAEYRLRDLQLQIQALQAECERLGRTVSKRDELIAQAVARLDSINQRRIDLSSVKMDIDINSLRKDLEETRAHLIKAQAEAYVVTTASATSPRRRDLLVNLQPLQRQISPPHQRVLSSPTSPQRTSPIHSWNQGAAPDEAQLASGSAMRLRPANSPTPAVPRRPTGRPLSPSTQRGEVQGGGQQRGRSDPPRIEINGIGDSLQGRAASSKASSSATTASAQSTPLGPKPKLTVQTQPM